MIGVVTMAGAPHVELIDRQHPDAAVYAGLSRAFPGELVDITSATRDGKKLVVSVTSASDPGQLYLFDRDSGDVYLGELNPRVCGASPMTNHAAFAYADVPLFLFHLLEFSGQDFDLDVEALNARWADPEFIDGWSQIVIKHTENNVDLVSQAPPTGIWKQASDGSVSYHRFDYHRAAVESERHVGLP